MKKIIFISTTNVTINSFLVETINELKKTNKIYILTNYSENEKKIKDVIYFDINFERQINILKDIISLFLLIKSIYKIKPDLIFSITPKAGFLGIAASFLLRVKVRIHIFTGQVWITKRGVMKKILKFADKMIFKLSTNCLVDSHAQKKFLIENKILKSSNYNAVRVLGEGSICGVDTDRFKPNQSFKNVIREQYNISKDDKVIIFVGRLNKDKGILDLVAAMEKIYNDNTLCDIHLLIVGQDEESILKEINFKYRQIIDKIHFVGFTENVEKYFAAADIFCLPSYREGFGMSVLEAGSSELPVIASNIYGLQDSIIAGKTGLFNEKGNIDEISNNILYLINNPSISKQMGADGRIRVQEKFEKKIIVSHVTKYIHSLLESLSKPSLAIVSSTQMSIEVFLVKQIIKLSKNFNITIYTKYENDNLFLKLQSFHNINYCNINIKRDIIILNDLYVFINLIFYFIFRSYDILFTITPKAGALAQFSGIAALINKRIHWFGGQVWFTKQGIKRKFLKFVDKLIYLSCTDCLTECISQKKFLEEQKIVKKDSLEIIGNGSICGVDLNRFKPNLESRILIRKKFNITDDKCVLLFLGRLNAEKGIFDLSKAVSEIIEENLDNNLHLMFVGPDEENIKDQFYLKYSNLKKIVTFVNFTNEPEKYMAAADIFCLPSHREGFGMAALEAAATSLPVINSNIYGLSDAVEKNITSLAFEVGSISQLKQNIKRLMNDKDLSKKLGENGRKRAKEKFNQEVVTTKIAEYFQTFS